MTFTTSCPECGGSGIVHVFADRKEHSTDFFQSYEEDFCSLCQGKGQVGLECEGRLLTVEEARGIASRFTAFIEQPQPDNACVHAIINLFMVIGKKHNKDIKFNGHPVKVVGVENDKP